MSEKEEIENLRRQLATARTEIKNLRQEIQSLSHVQRKELEHVRNSLKNEQCPNCNTLGGGDRRKNINSPDGVASDDTSINFKPIGIIRTAFPEKRCLPRQAVLGSNFLSKMEFIPSVFTNPEHSLEGLGDFSHIWLIYHFHKNSSHAKAKVAPPRLEGQRVGVFSSRSPHRPCPIGLSLVELDHISDNCIYFKGTDMVDGTPVLDIKPYIPHYDNPALVQEANNSHDDTHNLVECSRREAPDGEENVSEMGATGGLYRNTTTTTQQSSPTIKVPDWVTSGTQLNVSFSENALQNSRDLGVDVQALKNVLKSDPRSVYLRTRYGTEVYTFQLGDNTVSVQFDDTQMRAHVLQVRKTVRTEDLEGAE